MKKMKQVFPTAPQRGAERMAAGEAGMDLVDFDNLLQTLKIKIVW